VRCTYGARWQISLAQRIQPSNSLSGYSSVIHRRVGAGIGWFEVDMKNALRVTAWSPAEPAPLIWPSFSLLGFEVSDVRSGTSL
jgi:hypothetical protein